MASPLVGTVIITGGNGALGSAIAVAIAKKQPLAHLLLAVRDTSAESVQQVIEKIRGIGPRSVEAARIDLTRFASVNEFASNTVQRVKRKDIPPIIALVNSAASLSYVSDPLTTDGFDPVYQTNCLSPFLLTVSLLGGFRAGAGDADSGALVLNIGCSAISDGELDYFERKWGQGGGTPGTPLRAKEGNIRFGSSKLLMSAAMYGLRRSLRLAGGIPLNICTLDPGGMAGNSRLSTNMPSSVRFTHRTRASLRPLMRIFSKTAMNTTNVPAKIVAKLAFDDNPPQDSELDRYYILDDAYEASSIIRVLREQMKMEELLRMMMQQVRLGMDGMQSPAPSSPAPSSM